VLTQEQTSEVLRNEAMLEVAVACDDTGARMLAMHELGLIADAAALELGDTFVLPNGAHSVICRCDSCEHERVLYRD
jgi:hypothetical protein